MVFEQFYLGCLSHASYLIGDHGHAAVVDPQRDVDQYLDAAQRHGLVIRHIIETHLHADFVSGHRELAERTGARIYASRRASAGFPLVPVATGDEIAVGRLRLRVLETPGHTPESISLVVLDPEDGQARKVLTGDTLFVGEVGRPDLVASQGFSSRTMAEMLYRSLHHQLLTLPDEVEVYPAHGAGSACGRNIGTDRFTTIGRERRFNYALQPMSLDRFVELVTADLPPAPAYFDRNARKNRAGAPPVAALPPPAALSPQEVADLRARGAVLLDVREASRFEADHVPGALHIGLGGSFASWAGTLIEADRPIVLVADSDRARNEARVRLARVGLDSVAGVLAGGVDAWRAAGLPLSHTRRLVIGQLKAAIEGGLAIEVLDVRRPAEHQQGCIPGALRVPLDQLGQRLDSLHPRSTYAVVCAGGYRSAIACSLLKQRGFDHVLDVAGGTAAWIEGGNPVG